VTARRRFLLAAAMLLVIAVAAASCAGLRRAGQPLTASDAVQPFNPLTMDTESG
jgi:hypothetical protein